MTSSLFGPAVFLDVWAVRDMTAESASDLRQRLASALIAKIGSLLVSSVWGTELDTLKGASRTRAENFFTSLGAHWLLIGPMVSDVAAREARNDLGAFISAASLNGYILERSGELQRAGIDPHALDDDEFFDLGRTLAWTATEDLEESEDPKVLEALETLNALEDPTIVTTATQSLALKEAVKARADADRDEQRRDRGSYQRLYPPVSFTTSAMRCVHNAVWREVTRRSLGRTWMLNDGFDVAHLIPALAIGGFIAVDSDWQSIGQTAAADLPPNHAKLYRPGELELLVAELGRVPLRA